MLLGVKLLEREWGIRSAIFYIDNHAAILATRLTKPSPGHHIFDTLHSHTNKIMDRNHNLTITLKWISGHKEVMKKQTNKQRKPSQKAVAPSTSYRNTYKTQCYTASQHASKPSTTNSKHRCKKNGKNLHILTE